MIEPDFNEQIILGCILANPDYAIPIVNEYKFRPIMLNNSLNRKILVEILKMERRGGDLNLTSIYNVLKDKGIIPTPDYLLELFDNTVSSTQIIPAMKYLIEKYKSRRIQEMAKQGANVDEIKKEIDQYFHQSFIKPLQQNLTELTDELEKNEGKEPEFLTGLSDLDHILGGLRKGEVMIIGGHTSQGKTALALTFALNLLKKNKKICFWSLEMSDKSVLKRLITMLSGVYTFSNQRKTEHEWGKMTEALALLSQTSVTVLDNYCELDKALPLIKKSKPEILFIDYLQFIPTMGETRNIAVGKLSKQINNYAKENNIPVILLSQLARQDEDKTPTLQMLRDSGEIEQDASTVLFVYQAKKYDASLTQQYDKEAVYNIRIAKNRNGKANTKVQVFFDKAKMRFENLAK